MLQNAAAWTGGASLPLVQQRSSLRHRSIARPGGAVAVRARAFEAAPKSDKFVPKRGPGAGDLRKLGSSDLMVSCE